MAIRRKTKTNKKVEKQMEKVFMKDRRLTVSVGTTADFGKAKVQLSLSENVKEGKDPMDLADAIYELLVDKLEDKFDDLCEKVGVNNEDEENAENESEEDEETVADVEEEGEEDEDGENEENDITEEEILKMKKVALLALIEEEELDIDPKDHKKIADLREAVLDELFEDEEDGEEEDEDEDSWDEDDDEDSDEWND